MRAISRFRARSYSSASPTMRSSVAVRRPEIEESFSTASLFTFFRSVTGSETVTLRVSTREAFFTGTSVTPVYVKTVSGRLREGAREELLDRVEERLRRVERVDAAPQLEAIVFKMLKS